jgi:Trypsin
VKAVGFALSLLAGLALSAPAGAVDNGVPDGDAHANVGLLAFDIDGEGPTPPFALCTGSVISDDALLTAAHCIAAIPDADWVVTLDGGSPEQPMATQGFFPDDFPFAVIGPVDRSIGVVVHPDFGRGRSRINDLAVVLFPEGTFAHVTPVELPTAGLLDELAARGGLVGRTVTLVGYGTDAEVEPPRYFFHGYRQTATAPVQALTPRWLRTETCRATESRRTHRRTGSLHALDILTGRVVDNSGTGSDRLTVIHYASGGCGKEDGTVSYQGGRSRDIRHGRIGPSCVPASAQQPADAGCEGRFVAFNNQFFNFGRRERDRAGAILTPFGTREWHPCRSEPSSEALQKHKSR